MPMRTLAATGCVFCRTKDSAAELGIAVLRDPAAYDVLVIVDLNGKVVDIDKDLCGYHLYNHYGSFSIPESISKFYNRTTPRTKKVTAR